MVILILSIFKKIRFFKKKETKEVGETETKPQVSEEAGKEKRFKLRIEFPKIFAKKREKPVEEKPSPVKEAKPRIALKLSKPETKPVKERGILTREVYKSVIMLSIEGFVFGSLVAFLLYIVLTGFAESKLILDISNLFMLDNYTVLLIVLVPLGISIGVLGIDLIFKSQRGIGLLSVMSRRGRTVRTETRLPTVHPGRIVLAGVSMLIPLSGLLILYLYQGYPFAPAIGSVVLGIGMAISLYLFATSLKPAPPLPWYAALAVESKSISIEESRKLAQLIKVAGITASPSLIIAKYYALTIISIIITVAVSILVSVSIFYGTIAPDIGIAIIFMFSLIIIASMYYPYLKFNQIKNDRKRAVERELPFFAMYSSIMQTAGFNIDKAFERMIGNKLFPGIDREARILIRDIRLGTDPLEALTKLALDHPSKKFKDFIFGYTSVLRSGWNTQSYLSMRIREYTQEMKFNWRQYVERAGGIGEMLVTLFLMTTTLFVLIAVVLPYGIENMMNIFNFLLLPIVAVVMIQTIDALIPQPKIRDYYKTNIFIVAGIPLVSLIVISMVLPQDPNYPMYLLGSFIVSILLALGIDFQVQRAEIRGIESALPEFLRDITEYRKIGFPMLRAIFMIKDTNRRYNKYFDRLLNVIVAQLRAGVRLNKVKVPTRSWLGVFVFWLLGEVEDTGGGTPALLEEFTNLITELLDSRETARKQLRLYDVLTFITPVFLIIFVAIGAAISKMIEFVTGEQAGAMETLRRELGGVEMPIMLRPAYEAIRYAQMSVLVASLMLSLTMTKAVDLTPRNTVRPAIILSLAIVMVALTDMIANMFVKMVGVS